MIIKMWLKSSDRDTLSLGKIHYNEFLMIDLK